MVAMVLGATLAAMPSAEGMAAQPSRQTLKAINDINRYCTACWRNARLPEGCWTDCTQEVFSRLLERLPASEWPDTLRREGDERRELVRAIDAVKKRTQRARRVATYTQDIPDSRLESSSRQADERDQVLSAADEVLTPRQQRIIRLSLDGWSPQEIAESLTIPVARVSDEKYKAIRRLRDHLCQNAESL